MPQTISLVAIGVICIASGAVVLNALNVWLGIMASLVFVVPVVWKVIRWASGVISRLSRILDQVEPNGGQSDTLSDRMDRLTTAVGEMKNTVDKHDKVLIDLTNINVNQTKKLDTIVSKV